MSEAQESSDLIHQFLVAAGQDQIGEYQEAEDTRLIQALKDLPSEDIVSVKELFDTSEKSIKKQVDKHG